MKRDPTDYSANDVGTFVCAQFGLSAEGLRELGFPAPDYDDGGLHWTMETITTWLDQYAAGLFAIEQAMNPAAMRELDQAIKDVIRRAGGGQ